MHVQNSRLTISADLQTEVAPLHRKMQMRFFRSSQGKLSTDVNSSSLSQTAKTQKVQNIDHCKNGQILVI